MRERPHSASLRLDCCEAAVVVADPDRLEGLVVNLLDNALKYTPAKGTVRCALRREGDWAVLTVEDTGIGISAEDLPHIFERFYRVDRARHREIGESAHGPDTAVPGTGLGLAIARQIVEEAGGTISAESRQGVGSVFTVTLPSALLAPRAAKQPV
jgi:signal transduction histidine kinase